MRVLLIDYVLLARDIEYELKQRNIAVKKIPSEELCLEKFKSYCKEFKPDTVFTINFSPEIALLAGIQDLEYISWTIDPLPEERYNIHNGTQIDKCKLFIHDRNMFAKFANLGFQSPEFLALAAPENIRYPITAPEKLKPYECLISFAGQSLESERRNCIKQLRKTGKTRDLEKEINQWLIEVFIKEADNASFKGIKHNFNLIPKSILERLEPHFSEKEIGLLLDSWLSHILRIQRVKSLEKYDIKVYGDQYWMRNTQNYCGMANNGEELTCIYNASKINLDLPRIYQRNIVTMRVFDIMAAGGIIVSEKNDTLSELFTNGKNLFMYENSKDLFNIIENINNDPNLVREICKNARNEVLERHLIKHRIDKILKF